MYNITDIREIHLEVTSNCQAKCPMCARRINGGLINPFINISEITLEIFKKWFSIEFLSQLDRVFMCGNLGDPVVAKDTLEIFEYLVSIKPSMHLSMHTNGSARDEAWWQQLAKLNVKVVFAIDGLADTHSLYRVSTDWDKIIENASAFINAGGQAEWHMLAFAHNEHQIISCEELSKTMGFVKFQVKHTSRFSKNKFNVLNDSGKTIYFLKPTSRSIKLTSDVCTPVTDSPTIRCKSVAGKQIYVGASGNVTPCCWLDLTWAPHMTETRIDYMDKIGEFPNLNSQSLEEIFKSEYFDKIKETWWGEPLLECKKQCSNFDKLTEQFKVT
jgi:MoaA/NifB/PqqE/SkfB family radical SAM enzyme